jgi:hypothetical protein
MNLRRASKYAGDPAFWRGFRSGFVKSLTSPKNRARMQNSFRLSFYSAVAGSIGFLQWAKHSRATTGRPPLTTLQEMGVSLAGAFVIVAIVFSARYVWHRLRNA